MSIQDLLLAAQMIDHSQGRKHATLGKRGASIVLRNEHSDDDLVQPCPQQKRLKRNSGASVSSSTNSNRSSPQQGPTRSRRGSVNRIVHNQLEKTRRAQLRTGLELLNELLPSASETSRHTTLGLLTRARNHIMDEPARLVELDNRHKQLQSERERLLARLNALQPASSQSTINNHIGFNQSALSKADSVISEDTLSAHGDDIADLTSLDEEPNTTPSAGSLQAQPVPMNLTNEHLAFSPPPPISSLSMESVRSQFTLSAELLAQGLQPAAPRVCAYLPGPSSCANTPHLFGTCNNLHTFKSQATA